MDLPVPELEGYRAEKAMLFFSQVLQQYPSVEFVVKAEDGAYLQPQRLLMAADQWAAMQADYIGCMGFSKVANSARRLTHERYAHLLSAEYPMRALNPIYVLSRRAVESVARNAGRLRLLGGADDTSVALWMLRITSKYFDDQRLCATACRNNTVAVVSPRRPEGLDARRLASTAVNSECAAEAAWPLPYSARGDPELLKQRI
ncbi:hypothetical protein PLESTB_000193500 [Pleodorina starrii]|uniref:Uncharacterized protein n=1 Tax=Pleodorina starrii TaxID=330485 RepID=A0A9W6BBR9_9CHLO|nr:hypothetical protein PLESTM_000337800 [Pleodorina starrii]GLC49202.1 hypothetical protein PLESTB_000193500 [Pleodorina starrii]